MSDHKGFILPALLIGSFIIIFTLGFLSLNANFSQKGKNLQISQKTETDQFPGWKTYKNKSNEFTIRYPKQWSVVEYGDFAADFVDVSLKDGEASPSAIKIRYSKSAEIADIREFEKIHKLKNNQSILEPLDVKSLLTKNKNFKIGSHEAIEFQIERNFSAPQGPRKEFSQIYEVMKEKTIFKFSSHASQQEELVAFTNTIFSKIISSFIFLK